MDTYTFIDLVYSRKRENMGSISYPRKKASLKFVFAIFSPIFIFSPNDNPSKTLKNVFYFI